MRIIVTTAAGALFLGGVTLSTDYGVERTLRMEVEAIFEVQSQTEMTRDGEPVERGFGGGGSSSEEVRTVVRLDRFLEAAEGAPTRVRRVYETVERESVSSFGDRSFDDAGTGPLSGLVLELAADGDSEVTVEVVEGVEPDDESLLAAQRMALPTDALLPEDDVEEGASWALSNEAIQEALSLAVGPELFPPPDGERGERGQEGGDRSRRGRRGGPRSSTAQLLADAEWTGEATLETTEGELDGRPCAVITLALEGSGELPERSFGGGRRGRMPSDAPEPWSVSLEDTVELELSGRLFFSTEEHRPLYLVLEGDLSSERESEFERDGSVLSFHTTQEGALSIEVRLSEDGEDGDDAED